MSLDVIDFGVHFFGENVSALAERGPRKAGQFTRVSPAPKGELIPLTLTEWDAHAGTIDLVTQAVGISAIGISAMDVGEAFTGVAGRLSRRRHYEGDQTVIFAAGGLGLPPVYPIMRAHLRLGNHVTLIAEFPLTLARRPPSRGLQGSAPVCSSPFLPPSQPSPIRAAPGAPRLPLETAKPSLSASL